MTLLRYALLIGTAAELIVAALLGGCNIAGPIAGILEKPPSVAAQHDIEDRLTVVFVDDRKNVVERSGAVNPRQTRLIIAETVGRTLMAMELVTTTISPRDAAAYALRYDKHSQPLAIDDIGRAVGADQIIYVEMLEFARTSDGFTPKPVGSCRVRVIDVADRVRIFPLGDGSAIVDASVMGTQSNDYTSRSGLLRIDDALAEEIGRSIARLFYEYETLEVGSSINVPK
jgi:hypothetical protein